ncbi:hypothetical protein KP509_1Z085000 [Ceratopteris richardii]|nr:hypothetical protein KP509_1Z085000 [Ceratopteris richardii]
MCLILFASMQEDDVEQLSPADIYNTADSEIITSPREYLKTLNRTRGYIEEKQMESSPVVSALSEELKRALDRVQELERFQTSARKEVDCLLKRFSDERTLLRTREQEKIQAAVFSIEEELDKERRLRKRLELENKKLSRNLAEVNKAVVKAERELDKERKARQLMEDVCDELAREIGEDKAEVEDLKREHAREREEMDEERKTLQITEAWREERVQMKLLEAKYELEERCLALDNLKLELELYLRSRQAQMEHLYYEDTQGEVLKEAAEKLKEETSWSTLFLENGNHQAPQSQDDALSSDDFNSLRLAGDNTRGHPEYSNVQSNGQTKWPIQYTREESGEFLASDNLSRDDSGNIVSKLDVYNDMYIKSEQNSESLSRWDRINEHPIGFIGRQTAFATFDGSERNLDEYNEDEGYDAEKTWRNVRQNGYEISQHQKVEWETEHFSNVKVARGGIIERGSGSEIGSIGSSSPGSSSRMYKKGMRGRMMYRDQGNNGTGKKHLEHKLLVVTKQTEEGKNAVASVAEFSPSVYKHDTNTPIEQHQDWSAIPAYQKAVQSRSSTIIGTSIPQGRKERAQWRKPSKINEGFKMTALLDDRLSQLHLQGRNP